MGEAEQCNFSPEEAPSAPKLRRKLGLQLHLQDLGTFDEFGLAQRGIQVKRVIPNEAGHFAGVKDGDFILEIDGIPVQNLRGTTTDLLEAFTSFVRSTAVGDCIQLLVKRQADTYLLKIML